MDILTIITVLILLCTAFSFLNEKFIKLPGTIGVMAVSLVVSILILVAGKSHSGISATVTLMARSINFSKVLLDVMLGFLLFASAIHFDYKKLKMLRLPIFILSTIGVLISTGIFGGLLYLVTLFINLPIPAIYCFIFGALISPTDPIAVSSILKKSKIPARLNIIISGESLFNDAVGLILFVTLLGIVHESGTTTVTSTIKLFAQEVIGGIVIGAIVGYLGYRLIRSIRDFQTIVLISISMILCISLIAGKFHASVPLAAVTAGLLIGNLNFGVGHPANEHLNQVWQLLDEVLNTILFVMIGLQLIMMSFLNNYWLVGSLSIVILLFARLVTVTLPAMFVLRKVNFNNLTILTWAGLRGGISVAMALSLPNSPYRETILSATYFIVIFSILVQGLTLNKVVAMLVKNDANKNKN
ncbi:sodium:proton antiporter [Chryseobacterium gotjawalense]|uniref:Sodium:proton antiporter n=1 Tax=Chryseobacterium gotjawalense TaxID=3042315 RepID=A0ABY8RG41_9FLAO|nr:sodium:proton antiporter [Chryseobacterium sp. wdc7]WHF52761.1 sodium:proton antiporter [Chryseobacterium sp. wdc7]